MRGRVSDEDVCAIVRGRLAGATLRGLAIEVRERRAEGMRPGPIMAVLPQLTEAQRLAVDVATRLCEVVTGSMFTRVGVQAWWLEAYRMALAALAGDMPTGGSAGEVHED